MHLVVVNHSTHTLFVNANFTIRDDELWTSFIHPKLIEIIHSSYCNGDYSFTLFYGDYLFILFFGDYSFTLFYGDYSFIQFYFDHSFTFLYGDDSFIRFMENIHPSYFMEIIHSSYLRILFLFSGTSPHPCAVHPLLRPVALAGPRRDGKGRRRIAAPVLRAQRSRKKRC